MTINNHKATISSWQGAFWLRHQQEKIRITAEHCTSRDRLIAWVELQVGDSPVLYNFDEDSLPEHEPMLVSVVPQPSRPLAPPKHTDIIRPKYASMADQMAERREQGTIVEGPQAPRITLTCSNSACAKVFERLASRHKYQVEHGIANAYCSHSCQSQVHPKSVPYMLTCDYCKQTFEREARRRAGDKSSQVRFCNRVCKNQYFREHPTSGKAKE